MGIELLALALDGVMFDTEEAHVHACNAAFDFCGMRVRWGAVQFREAARTWGANNAISAVTSRMGASISKHDAENLLQEKNRFFHQYTRSLRPALHAGCARLMDEALAAGAKLAVVTDMQAKTANALLEQAFGDNVNHRFAVVVSGADFHAPAGNGPHDLAARTAGVDIGRCVAIEAAAPGQSSAQASAIWTIAATPYEKDIAHIGPADTWWPQMQQLGELLVRKTEADDSRARFVTFDMLRAMKKRQPIASPTLRQRPQLRRVA